jgi:hypothetical protein
VKTLPWIDDSTPWPACVQCKLPMQHFLQLDLAELPAEINNQFGDGLLQLFYCTRGACQGMGGWEAFDGLNHARVVHRSANAVSLTDIPEQEESYPPKHIVGWTKIEEQPVPVEHSDLGLNYEYDRQAGTIKLLWRNIPFMFGDLGCGRITQCPEHKARCLCFASCE